MGGGVQIVRFADERVVGLVANNVDRDAVFAAGAKKIPDTGKRIGLSHTWAIDVALQGGPLGFASGSTEMVTDSNFVGGNTGGYEPAFRRDAMEERVVADDGIVEIKT